MPSPGEDIQSWSVTATNNGSADPLINWVEGQTRASVNNSSRSEMAAHAKDRNLRNGSIVTTGSANAQAFLSGVGYTSVPTGLVVKLKIGAGLTNTASTTLNMDGIGATLIKTPSGDDLLGGELVADCYTDLIYNGTNWVFLYSHDYFIDRMTGGGGIIIGKQIFTAGGTYTPTPGMEACIIECVGGGGGSGAASAGVNEMMAGGGGGGGGYARKIATAAEVGASQTVTVGAGGGGGSGSGAGLTGGTTSLGSLCSTTGGAGGGDATLGNIPPGGTGGIGTIGDLLCNGSAGGPGFYSTSAGSQGIYVRAGSGGSSALGGGGQGCAANTGGGQAGGNYGGGGGGSASFNGAGLAGGSSGAGGIVIVTEFAGRGAPGRDGNTGATGPIGPPGPAGAGTGDVLVFGTPSAGQLAQWQDTSHIQGVSAASVIGSTAITNIVLQKFTASGTYTPTTGMKFCILECIGGGGGGGAANAASNEFMVGGGGGAGGYSRKRASAADIGASQVVTIGAAGTGGSSAGGAGGNSSVGALCIANGGLGGGQALSGNIPAGGAGGAAGTGDIVAAGAPGMPGFHNASTHLVSIYMNAGMGGSSMLGGGAAALAATNGGGNAGGNYGGGASGSASLAGGLATGSAGATGVVIITEFI